MLNTMVMEMERTAQYQYRVVVSSSKSDGAAGAIVYGLEAKGKDPFDYAVIDDISDDISLVQLLLDTLIEEEIEADQLLYAVEDYLESLNDQNVA